MSKIVISWKNAKVASSKIQYGFQIQDGRHQIMIFGQISMIWIIYLFNILHIYNTQINLPACTESCTHRCTFTEKNLHLWIKPESTLFSLIYRRIGSDIIHKSRQFSSLAKVLHANWFCKNYIIEEV
jgi:hypothetical protein